MKTIAIDARIIRSGTGRYIERMLHYLEQLDTENRYLILVRKADFDYYKPKNPNFKIVEADFADYSFSEQIGFARLLYKLKPDLVHFCMPQQPLLYLRPSVTSVLDLNLLRITANDMHPIELRIKKMIFGVLLWIVAHRSKHIISISEYTKRDLVAFSRISPQKITVMHLAAELPTAAPKPVQEYKDIPFLLYVGRAEAYKNNRGLIEAHQQLLRSRPNLRLIIVGRKDELREADIKWVEAYQYKNVDFLGFVEDAQLAWLYKHCAAYVVPSLMEGFGLPGLEAMAYGAPVVSSNTTCLPEIYRDGAYYFNPTLGGDMERALSEVLNDDRLRTKLIANARKVHGMYSWRKMAEQVLDVYKKH